MKALPLALLLTACASPRIVAVCPPVANPNAVAVVCTQQPRCKSNCYLTVTAAQSIGGGDQTVTSSDAPSVSETRTTTGPLP